PPRSTLFPYTTLFRSAPDVFRQPRLMEPGDGIADGLTDALVVDDGNDEIVPGEEVELFLTVVVLAEGALHLAVIAPAGQLQPLIARLAGLDDQLLQRQVRPRTAAQDDGSGHP